MLSYPLSFLQKHQMALCATTWLCAILFGFGTFIKYENTAGAPGRSIANWPECSSLTQNRRGNTLIMVLHPRCPCSRASLELLSKIMIACNHKLSAQILLFVPSNFPIDWKETDIWKQAAEIPEIQLLADRDGVEAQNFGAVTSGQTYIFDKSGLLKFSGGITEFRGHTGENFNLDLANAALRGEIPDSVFTPVYGCPIKDSPTVSSNE